MPTSHLLQRATRLTGAVVRTLTLVTLTVALASCSDLPIGPGSTGNGLVLAGRMENRAITADQKATFQAALLNAGSSPVTLTFPSSCQIGIFVTRRPAGEIVVPGGGSYVCAAVVSTLTLAPGESTTLELLLRSEASAPPGSALPPGDYEAYASLQHPENQLRSPVVAFTVR